MSFPDFHFFPPYCRSVEEGVDKHEHNKHSSDAAAEVVDQMTQGSEIINEWYFNKVSCANAIFYLFMR